VGQYSPDVGLIREAPTVEPDRYWLFNDNYIASYVLRTLGEQTTSEAIVATLRKYGIDANGLTEVLVDRPVEWPPRTARTREVDRLGKAEILVETADGADRVDDWEEYANLAMLGAILEARKGSKEKGQEVYGRAIRDFDGSGLRDKAFKATYETYKLALALYAGYYVGAPMGERGAALAQALLAQQETSGDSSGGFYTHYPNARAPKSDGVDTNAETTSLALLALSAHSYYAP
jgi:hypothetical protein